MSKEWILLLLRFCTMLLLKFHSLCLQTWWKNVSYAMFIRNNSQVFLNIFNESSIISEFKKKTSLIISKITVWELRCLSLLGFSIYLVILYLWNTTDSFMIISLNLNGISFIELFLKFWGNAKSKLWSCKKKEIYLNWSKTMLEVK